MSQPSHIVWSRWYLLLIPYIGLRVCRTLAIEPGRVWWERAILGFLATVNFWGYLCLLIRLILLW